MAVQEKLEGHIYISAKRTLIYNLQPNQPTRDQMRIQKHAHVTVQMQTGSNREPDWNRTKLNRTIGSVPVRYFAWIH